MSYCRTPWYIWRGGDGVHFQRPDLDASEAVCVPTDAMRCFLDAWLRMWPSHMTAEGMLKRLELDPEPTGPRHGPR